jgi:23S rRNA (cytosine1962-C5)-methyltransferase
MTVLALPVLRLKKERAEPARAGHPWLFSGAFEAIPALDPGSLCRIEDAAGGFVAVGYVNPARSLAVRLLAWREIESIDALLDARLDAALALRAPIAAGGTDAYRLIASEGDFLPGLIVDRYGDVLVMQVQTAGMERLRDRVIALLATRLQPRTIYERSDIPVRREEDLPMRKGVVHGAELPEEITIHEHGRTYLVQPQAGQKTGFFLDQREHRNRVERRAAGRRVLNCFAYTGGFSVAAWKGGAATVTSVESSEPAVALLRRNLELGGCEPERIVHGDAFQFLREARRGQERYDLVILDPPAFAKKKHQVEAAARGYKEINLQALEILAPGGELFTFSCSQYVDAVLFKKVVFGAGADARASVQLLERLGHPLDHPVSMAHPEGEYLKGLHLRRL